MVNLWSLELLKDPAIKGFRILKDDCLRDEDIRDTSKFEDQPRNIEDLTNMLKEEKVKLDGLRYTDENPGSCKFLIVDYLMTVVS